MKSNRMNTIKSRRLKSKKYKRKTRVRVHLGKNKQRGGAICEIDFTDRDNLYVNYKNDLYKLKLNDKIFETYDPEKGDYVNPRLLKEIPRNLHKAILKTILSNNTDKQKIMEIFAEHDIDPFLPMKISPSPSSSRKSSSSDQESPPQALSPSTSSFSPSPRPDSDRPSFSEASPRKSSSSHRESSSKALGRVTPLKMEKLKDAMNFAKTYKSKSNQLPPLRSRPSVSDIIYESPYSKPLQRPLQRPLLIPLRQSRQTRKNR